MRILVCAVYCVFTLPCAYNKNEWIKGLEDYLFDVSTESSIEQDVSCRLLDQKVAMPRCKLSTDIDLEP